jgi:hypothetical protein
MDNRLIQDSQIEDALKHYPMADMPHSITNNVMARIQKDVRPQLVTWNDFVLSFVIALCIGALYFTVLNLPPIMLAKIKIQGILLYQSFLVNARWLVPNLFFGFAALLSALTIPSLIKMTVDRRR